MWYPIYSLYLALHCKWSKTNQNNNIFSPVFAASGKKQQCGLRRQHLKGPISRIACFKTHFLQGGVKTEVSHTVEKPQHVFIWVIYYKQQVRLICSYISSRCLINSTYICVCVTLAQTKVYWWGPDGVEGALPPQPAVNKLTMEPPTVRAKCDAICGCEAARGDELWPLNLPPTPPVTLHSGHVPRWPRTRREKRGASKCKREVGWKRRMSQSLRRASGSERGWTRRFKNNKLRANSKAARGKCVTVSEGCCLFIGGKCRKCNPRRVCKARTLGPHNHYCLPSYDDMMFSDNE